MNIICESNRRTSNCGALRAFSLAELMVVMLILTIILAATMPILSKRAKVKAAAAAAGGIKTANEGDTCVDGTDTIAYSKNYSQILVCQPEATLGDSCSTIGAKAVDRFNMSGTDNPYVHLVCVN